MVGDKMVGDGAGLKESSVRADGEWERVSSELEPSKSSSSLNPSWLSDKSLYG